jgi:hypothetical protein
LIAALSLASRRLLGEAFAASSRCTTRASYVDGAIGGQEAFDSDP